MTEKLDSCPAIWAIDLIDEPNANDFEYYQNYAQIIYEEAPGIECYINLFPNYANYNQLGVKSYDLHIAKYVSTIDTDYICYDHYFYFNGIVENFEYSNFIQATKNYSIVAKACKENDKDFWIVIQANSSDGGQGNEPYAPLSETQLKIQAFVSLAYGATVINWAGWQDGICWWQCNILDSSGNKSDQYYKVQHVNELIDTISPIFMRYEWVETSVNKIERKHEQDFVYSFKIEQHSDDRNLLDHVVVGFFNKRDGGEGNAMMIVNISDFVDQTADGNSTATFKFALEDDNKDNVIAYYYGIPQRIYPDENGEYSLEIKNGDCVFVTID